MKKKKNPIHMIEKNVTEDSASSLKAIKFISFKGLETSTVREPESKGD